MLKTQRKVDIVTLGCSKNLIDSERLLAMFARQGFEARHDPDATLPPSPTVVINTCGFISDAKEESINTILQYVQAKTEGRIKRLYVMGCLSERYAGDLPTEIPEVDAWYGKFNWTRLVADLMRIVPGEASYDRVITTPSHHAYLKIAEGCNRFCAFCAIPLITGRYTSRPVDEIINEVKDLSSRGVKEINVIAQDLSSYGTDLAGGKMRLPELIDRMADIDGIEWIRLHYAYPSSFPWDITKVMATRPNVCSYLDIALQHIADPVLTNMRRHITGAQTRDLLKRLRDEVPGLHLRTTLMVGFPGEGQREFDQLMEFVAEQRFERMGAFAYCEEDDTYAAKHLADTITDEVKQDRLSRLMALQEEISFELQQAKVGTTQRVIIDREDAEYYVGRTQWDSPEVDPEVLIAKERKLKTGEFYNVVITEALPFDLISHPCAE